MSIYYIYRHAPSDSGTHMESEIVAKFELQGHNFEILENHGIDGLEDMSPKRTLETIRRLAHSSRYRVVKEEDLQHHQDLFQEPPDSNPELDGLMGKHPKDVPPEEYEYNFGNDARVLSVDDGNVFLDGFLLTQPEIDRIHENVNSGKATFKRLAKTELPVKSVDRDTEIPEVGNIRAFRNYTPTGGYWLSLQTHDHHHLRDTHGSHVADRAIKAIGTGLAHSAFQHGQDRAAVFRIGKDQFVAHVPTRDVANLLARGVRQRLENTAPVNGTHKLGVAIGMGNTADEAHQNLHHAVSEKTAANLLPGQHPSYTKDSQ